MNRSIIETELQASETKSDIDNYFDKIVKYIPSEIVGVWITIKTMVEGNNNVPENSILWGIFIFCLFLTFAYICLLPVSSKKKPTIKQGIISVGAFIVWAIAIGGKPFISISWYQPIYGSILMVLYTVVIPLIPLEIRKLN